MRRHLKTTLEMRCGPGGGNPCSDCHGQNPSGQRSRRNLLNLPHPRAFAHAVEHLIRMEETTSVLRKLSPVPGKPTRARYFHLRVEGGLGEPGLRGDRPRHVNSHLPHPVAGTSSSETTVHIESAGQIVERIRLNDLLTLPRLQGHRYWLEETTVSIGDVSQASSLA
jgi:hypothetical protein